ncbi:Uroporphyrinogen-III C-methyltransferase [Anoxybacillus sp. BCO1]|nr:Uroporphyrinogen-III C-methyltransferase [Anoxybacillus sp. BCO1]
MANIAYICEQLQRHGKDGETPVAVIEWATTTEQRTVVGTLQTIVDIVHEKQLSSPAIIVVGDVVRLHDQLKWVEEKW